MAKTYRINEIFYSLQGEGFHTGTPAVFVRFSGCNLACPFCDTDFASFTEMTLLELVDTVSDYLDDDGPFMIVLTGGEPALQVDEELLTALHTVGHVRIHIETNGTKPLPKGIDWVTCSPKEGTKPVLKRVDELKVVFTEMKPMRSNARNQWRRAEQQVEPWREAIRAEHYFLQPCSCANTEETVNYILAHPWWRLSLQTHKYINIR